MPKLVGDLEKVAPGAGRGGRGDVQASPWAVRTGAEDGYAFYSIPVGMHKFEGLAQVGNLKSDSALYDLLNMYYAVKYGTRVLIFCTGQTSDANLTKNILWSTLEGSSKTVPFKTIMSPVLRHPSPNPGRD